MVIRSELRVVFKVDQYPSGSKKKGDSRHLLYAMLKGWGLRLTLYLTSNVPEFLSNRTQCLLNVQPASALATLVVRLVISTTRDLSFCRLLGIGMGRGR